MQGDERIIELLNEVLTGELTAVNQYFVHGELCTHWGYSRLGAHLRAESIDEMRHADMLVKRILLLDGLPNLQRLGSVKVGEDVPEMFRLDRAVEAGALDRLQNGVALAVAAGDTGTRELLAQLVVASEHHLDWIEAQQRLIDQVGLQNYLAQQLG